MSDDDGHKLTWSVGARSPDDVFYIAFQAKGGDEPMLRIFGDGRVVKSESIEWDEAAKLFWNAVDATRTAHKRGDEIAIILTPTDGFEYYNASAAGGSVSRARIWIGHDDAGVPVKALVAKITPQSHEPAVRERYANWLIESAR